MSQFGGSATPFPGGLFPVGDDEYALWDAAYVMGSLTATERREYEAHLSTCLPCREAVAELSGMPALLSQLSSDDVAAMDDNVDAAAVTPPLRPQLLTSLLSKVSRRRRRSRLVTWTLAAVAAAVLVVGAVVAVRSNPAIPTPTPPAQAQSTSMTMTRMTPNGLSSTVSLSSQGWGTRIDMTCTYGVWPEGAEDDDAAGDRLAMVVVGRDGTRAQLATWVALTGVTATPVGSTSMPMDQIAAVQVVSLDNGEVLLQRSL
ncbi:MAG TPA: zf-HC2 domain-containing protein [Mycobacterium sp.]|nr:zf-HC2 domain-containing protein [Mycobacterium sp.]